MYEKSCKDTTEAQASFKNVPRCLLSFSTESDPESFQFFGETDFKLCRLYALKKRRDTCMCVYVCVFTCERGWWNAFRSQKKHQAWRELRLTRIVLISAFPSLKLWPLPSITPIPANPNFQQVKPISGEKSQHALSTYYVHTLWRWQWQNDDAGDDVIFLFHTKALWGSCCYCQHLTDWETEGSTERLSHCQVFTASKR